MTAKRKPQSKKKGSTSTRKKAADRLEWSPYQDEIVLIVSFAISLLIILSNFHLSGKFGQAINVFVFGVFGFLAYLLPFILFIGIAFYISNRANKNAKRKLGCIVLLYVMLTGLLQLISARYSSQVKLLDYYKTSSSEKNGGGLVGGALSRFLCGFFGEIGAYIILIAVILIAIMFITEKFLFAGIGKHSSKKIEDVRERRKIYLEEQEAAIARGEIPKRKAKTFTFKKEENKRENSNLEDNIQQDNKKGSRSKKKETAGMEPIIAPHANTPNIPIYEEELNRKFNSGSPEAVQEPMVVEPDIPINSEVTIENSTKVDEQIDDRNDTVSGFESNMVEEATNVEQVKPVRPEAQTNSKSAPSVKTDATSQIEPIQIQPNYPTEEKRIYQFPSIDLLSKPKNNTKGMSDGELKATALKLKNTLDSFGVRVTVTNISRGPAVTRYELQPEQGVKVSRITNLADDIKLNLAAADVRIEAPIPGKAAVGIEVPNKENTAVMLRELIESKEFQSHSSDIAFAVGKDISGQTVVTDIAKMPHLLIAGATGSGKSVCINTLIMSILYKSNPDDVKLIMVDPKVVELSVYNGIPHLLIPVVTDPKKASGALNWAVMEMTERYKKFADLGVRDLKGYNEKVATVAYANDEKYQKMPQIVIIVDELADLMMVAPGEVEDAICRLAQMARAAGLHLIIATQRPSVNVITGLIKANVPSRIAFSVSSAIDSRTIIDGSGAEKLLGKGDMLFFPSGYPKPVRIQGAFVSDKEVGAVVEFLTSQNSVPQYNEDITNHIVSNQIEESTAEATSDRDEYFIEAGKFIIEKDKASIGMLQRVYKIGFNRAARIMDQLCEAGVVGAEEGTKPRKVLMSMEEFENYVDEYV